MHECRCAWLHNRWSPQAKLSVNECITIWWAGMMRGAVSVAMVYYKFDPKNHNEDPHSATIVVTTLQVVLYSTVGMGGVTGPLLQYLLPQQVQLQHCLSNQTAFLVPNYLISAFITPEMRLT
jgi:solute carrier family 9 (sodium/hydrogen exchanger), member 8